MPKLSNMEIEVMEDEYEELDPIEAHSEKKKISRKDGVRQKLDEHFEARRMKQELGYYD